ncbi:hypothetical protein [Streptomyces sp. NPDC058295]
MQRLGPLAGDRRRLGDRHLDGGDGVGLADQTLQADPLRRGSRNSRTL